MYDITNAESFNRAAHWLNETGKYALENINKVLLGNKLDLQAERAVEFVTAKVLFCKANGELR